MTIHNWTKRRLQRGVSNAKADKLLAGSPTAAWVVAGGALVARGKDGIVYNCVIVAHGAPKPESALAVAVRKALRELDTGERGAAIATLETALGGFP